MNTLKILGVVLFLGVITTFGSEIGERLSLPGARYLAPTAQAIVGRPLTPVSIAGVGRRTVRRCAVGVYNCGLPGPRSADNLLGRTSPGPVLDKSNQAASSSHHADVRPAAAQARSDPAAG